MTGAATVVWFLGRKGHVRSPEDSDAHVELDKPDTRIEAQQAVRDSVARSQQVTGQRGVVSRVVTSLAEIRRENHFGENIRAAMGGDK